MGLGGISIWQLVIILVIVLLIFGTKRLKNLGGDVGGAIKGFKDAMTDDEDEQKQVEGDDAVNSADLSKQNAEENVEDKV